MKQKDDDYTLDIFCKPGRGRPRKPNAKPPAQRMREMRARKKFDSLINVTRDEK